MALDHAGRRVAVQRLARAPRSQLSRRLPLPIFALAPNLGHLGRPMPLGERPERRAGFDRLQLLDIAHQHDLGPCPLRLGQDALHLTRTDHARLVDHQHVPRGELIPPLRPTVLEIGDRPRADPRTALQALRGDPRQGGASHLIARRLPSLAGHAQHRALARARVADDDCEVVRTAYMS